MRYTIEAKGIAEVNKEKRVKTDEFVRKARGVMSKIARRVERDAKRAAPVDVGLLRSKIAVDEKYAGQAYRWEIGIFDPQVCQYAVGVEEGTGPRNPNDPNTWPPIGALIEWARRKGMGEGAAYAIQRAIVRRGTKPQPFLRPAFQSVETEVNREMGKLRQ